VEEVEGLIDFGGALRAAKGGDEEAFASLWREFHPWLLRYLNVKAAPAAEDLAADTWLRILQALPTFEGDEDGFRAWIFVSARNRVTDWYRSGARRPDFIENSKIALMPASNTVESEAAERSATDAALVTIATLPPDQAEAVTLRIVVGLDVASVATIMKRSPGSVRVLCHRGLRRLEEMLNSAELPVTDVEGRHESASLGIIEGLPVLEEGRLHG
jgi:RNA polymerase sigma-70 factor (ECF subfamily)